MFISKYTIFYLLIQNILMNFRIHLLFTDWFWYCVSTYTRRVAFQNVQNLPLRPGFQSKLHLFLGNYMQCSSYTQFVLCNIQFIGKSKTFILHILVFFLFRSVLAFFDHIISFNAYLRIIRSNNIFNLIDSEYFTCLTSASIDINSSSTNVWKKKLSIDIPMSNQNIATI